jgi:hypothetical protein
MVDFSAWKFHPSCLGRLMTNDRSGKNVGETCKSALLDIWIEATYDRSEDFTNKYTEKGTLVEEAAITLYSTQKRKFYKKNIETFEDDYFIGTPDIVTETELKDIKSSWSLFTFYDNIHKKINKDYELQLQGYYKLVKKKFPNVKTAGLVYVLVNTPLFILEQEKTRFRYKFEEIDPDINPVYRAGVEQIEKNGTFDDIPEADRWMEFTVEERDLTEEYKRLDWCRDFLNQLNKKA